MTRERPLWAQGLTFPARVDRQLIDSIWDEGVQSGLSVVQHGSGDFTVDVNIGQCVIKGDDQVNQGSYIGQVLNGVERVTIAAPPGSNSRIDLVIARVFDPDAGSGSSPIFSVEAVTGTAGASPSPPATPNTAIVLAQVAVAAGQASVLTANLTDKRVWAGSKESPGVTKDYCGSMARIPNGWLLADGSAVSRTTYARLFDSIGTTFGVGDGSTTFNLPDFRTRVGVGYKSGDATFGTIGATGGETAHTLTTTELPSHNHGVTDPSHTHRHLVGTGGAAGAVSSDTQSGVPTYGTGWNENSTTGITINNAGGGGAHNIMQPYVVVGKLIRT